MKRVASFGCSCEIDGPDFPFKSSWTILYFTQPVAQRLRNGYGGRTVFDDDVCAARYAILQPNSKEGRAQCFVAVALRNWTSGRLAGDRGREGVTYCILWGVERSQMDFICLVRCSSGLSLSFLSLCAHYNPLLLLQLTLISTSTRVSCLLLLLSDSALALNSSRPNVLREI